MSNRTKITDKATEPKVMGDKEKHLKRKQSLEASVTLGLGYGKKKQRHVEAFYSAVWPVLKDVGWSLVSAHVVHNYGRVLMIEHAGEIEAITLERIECNAARKKYEICTSGNNITIPLLAALLFSQSFVGII